MTNTTLLQTRVTPNDCEIRRGSGCPLRAPCPNSGPRRWLSRCLCLIRRGRWPDPLPSSCSRGWWRPPFTAGCEESQSCAERSANECSALLPHPGGVPSPSVKYLSSPRRLLLLRTHEVMACQAASATASLREVLKAGPLCRHRILDPKKISAIALNSTRPERGTSLILYRGAVVMPRCFSKARSLPVRIRDLAPKDSTSSASWYNFSDSVSLGGKLFFISLIFCTGVLWLLLFHWRILSSWSLRNH
jgi:hypothetical protein